MLTANMCAAFDYAGLVLCACSLLMVDLHITGRLLIGMGKKLKSVQL